MLRFYTSSNPNSRSHRGWEMSLQLFPQLVECLQLLFIGHLSIFICISWFEDYSFSHCFLSLLNISSSSWNLHYIGIMYKIIKFGYLKLKKYSVWVLLKTLLTVFLVTVKKKQWTIKVWPQVGAREYNAVIRNGFTLKIRLVSWYKLFIFAYVLCFKAICPKVY